MRYIYLKVGLRLAFLLFVIIYRLLRSLGGVSYTSAEEQKEYEEWLKTNGNTESIKYGFLLIVTLGCILYLLFEL